MLGFATEPPLIAPTGPNGAMVAWFNTQLGPNGQSRGAYAQRLLPDQVVPVAASTRTVEAGPEHVRIVWDVTGAASDIPVLRRTPTSGWAVHGLARARGRDELAFEDREIVPVRAMPTRWAMGWPASCGSMCPPRRRSRWRASTPNPAGGVPSVAFTLDSGATGRLEVFDPSGRRIASHEVGGQGSGRFVLEIDRSRGLAPGVYVIRLSQSGRSLTARGIVIR